MTISLDIVTPNGSVFQEEDCEIIILQSKQGELGIMAGHISTVAALIIAILLVNIIYQYEYFDVTEVFAEIIPSKVTVLVQAGEFAEDKDTERAEAARGRSEE